MRNQSRTKKIPHRAVKFEAGEENELYRGTIHTQKWCYHKTHGLPHEIRKCLECQPLLNKCPKCVK